MEFRHWLEDSSNIVFTNFMANGVVVCYINGKQYKYLTDAMYHPKWKKMVEFGPGRVLNQIKDLVNQGLAQQLSPAPEPEKTPEPVKPPVFKQTNLFPT
jgi:hypothetical protein